MRIIVTGSRYWPDSGKVHFELGISFCNNGPFALVHGACPAGADMAAAQWATIAGRGLGCTEEPHPADWKTYGRRAGPLRNERMIEAGADLVLAFPLPGGRGTQHMMRLAERAGIPVRNLGEL